MSRFWTELARGLTPYTPGEQPVGQRLVKLNTNENPYPPSPAVMRAIAAVGDERLRLYPDPRSTRLRAALATRHGLQPSQVFVGNGSDEVLAFAFLALLKHDEPLCFPDVTYSFYPVWSDLCAIRFREIALDPALGIDLSAYPMTNGGIIVPNPNAPTGTLLPDGALRKLLERNRDSVVVVDEAYIDFGGESAASMIDEFDNLLVVQTMSKSRALAGLRVGFALGHEALIEGLERIKDSFNSYPLDVLAEEAALASLQDEAYFRQSCTRIIATRQRLTSSLLELGLQVLPSCANFILARHPGTAGADLYAGLRARGILVRHFSRPRIDDYVRISIGTDADCDLLVAELGAFLRDR